MTGNALLNERAREELVQKLVHRLGDRGYLDIRVSRLDVYADNRPRFIHWEASDEGYLPDITARKDRSDYLFQVETCETLSDPQTERKIYLFAAYARHYRKQFCLVVPDGCRVAAKNKIFELKSDEQFTHVLGVGRQFVST
ncbi:MAG: hypothetical protein WDA20_13225 [Desulfuromonadales bacterium]|jgi:hypothetical protein